MHLSACQVAMNAVAPACAIGFMTWTGTSPHLPTPSLVTNRTSEGEGGRERERERERERGERERESLLWTKFHNGNAIGRKISLSRVAVARTLLMSLSRFDDTP